MVLYFYTICMPTRIFTNVTLKYWHLHAHIHVIFNRLLFIVVIIELVTLELLYLAVTLFVFVQQFLVFVCTCNTLVLAVYEFAGVPLAAWAICKWGYIYDTFCWIIKVVNLFSSQLLIPNLEFRCGCYALLTLNFVVSSFISRLPRCLQCWTPHWECGEGH